MEFYKKSILYIYVLLSKALNNILEIVYNQLSSYKHIYAKMAFSSISELGGSLIGEMKQQLSPCQTRVSNGPIETNHT